jgi:hypothetical protein
MLSRVGGRGAGDGAGGNGAERDGGSDSGIATGDSIVSDNLSRSAACSRVAVSLGDGVWDASDEGRSAFKTGHGRMSLTLGPAVTDGAEEDATGGGADRDGGPDSGIAAGDSSAGCKGVSVSGGGGLELGRGNKRATRVISAAGVRRRAMRTTADGAGAGWTGAAGGATASPPSIEPRRSIASPPSIESPRSIIVATGDAGGAASGGRRPDARSGVATTVVRSPGAPLAGGRESGDRVTSPGILRARAGVALLTNERTAAVAARTAPTRRVPGRAAGRAGSVCAGSPASSAAGDPAASIGTASRRVSEA